MLVILSCSHEFFVTATDSDMAASGTAQIPSHPFKIPADKCQCPSRKVSPVFSDFCAASDLS